MSDGEIPSSHLLDRRLVHAASGALDESGEEQPAGVEAEQAGSVANGYAHAQLALLTTLPIPGGAGTVRLTARNGNLEPATVPGTLHKRLAETVAHMFRLDEDLSRFYELVRDDELSWCAFGAGRMLRTPTVFEDVVKTDRTRIRKARTGCEDGS